ncbi:MAG: 2-heptaprenyl,4-naphthoquinone methyltransferase [Burkholderiales bacterium]|jgi:ubiquinone/menaquinone biosynthesis C-methylase UbiE|nr:2-heptaprenyl,4-naphthoquinone methyltransferase [Burkholderiales bacterium]
MPNSSLSELNSTANVNYYSNIHHHFDLDSHNIFANSQKIAIKQLLGVIHSTAQILPDNNLGVVVDVGCGTGNMLLMLNSYFTCKKFFGVDLSSEMLNIAKSKISNLITICDSAANIAQHFPLPIAGLLISHFIFAYIDYKNLLVQFSKITKPGSLLSICSTTTNTFANTKNDFIKNLLPKMRLIKFFLGIDGQDAINIYSKFMPQNIHDLQIEIEQNGYKIINAENLHFTITLKTWREAWSFFHDGSWFVGVMKQYKVNKFKMFCIFNFLKIAGLFKNSNGIFKDDMEIVVITAIRV